MATFEAQPAVERRIASERRFWESRVFVPILLFFIIGGFYWKLTLTKQYDWVWGPDLAQQVLPWFMEEARQMQHSELPLWDPHMWSGQPMLGQAQPGTAYPLNWVLFMIPRSHDRIRPVALQWYFILIHYMAALFCYLLCRDLGRSKGASMVAGLIFALASYVGTTDWPQMVNGAVWAPLVFLFLLRAVRGYRPLVSAALCGTFLGMAWLAGHHQVPMYITLTMGGTWLYFILRGGRIDVNMAKLAAVAVIFMVLVGSLQILPAQEYGHLAKRWAGAPEPLAWNEPVPYYVHQEYSMYPMSLLAILIPGLNRHADPFIGVVGFSLALMAVALCWKHRAVKLFAAIAIGAIVYSLGFNSVFQGFLYAVVPMVEKARVPSMATIIWGFGAAVLAAFGLDHFALESDSVWARRLVAGILGFGLLMYYIMIDTVYAKKGGWDTDDRVGVTALVTVLLAALLYAWRKGNLTGRTSLVLLTMLMLLELGNDSGFAFPHRADKDRTKYIEEVRSNQDIADFLHQQPGPFRVEAETDKLSVNWGNYHNFDILKGLGASVTTNVLDTEFFTWQTRQLFGVRWTVTEKPPFANSIDRFTGASGLKLYENPDAFPRAWAVHQLIPIANADEGRRMINDHLGDLRTKAMIYGKAPTFPVCGGDDISFKKYSGETVIITAQMACGGMVVLSDTYFPDWKATLDGKPVPIQEVNLSMRGVAAPQGKHEIAMRYRPKSVYFGGLLTLLGWLGAIGLVKFGPKNRLDERDPHKFILT